MSREPDRAERADAVMDALHESEREEIVEGAQSEVEETAKRFEAVVERKQERALPE